MTDRDARPSARHAELAELLRRLGAAMGSLSARISAGLGVHPTDESALRVLHAVTSAPITIGELGASLQLSSAAVTSLVDRLERGGHVERVRDADDRRRVRVRPTQRSYRVAGEQLQDFLDRLDAALDDFDEHELRAARRFLEVVLEALEPAEGPHGRDVRSRS